MSWTTLPRRLTVAVGVLAVGAGIAVAPTAAVADAGCQRFASPSGSDSAAGTATAPYRSATRLASSLSSGQTGCLYAGSYTGDVSLRTSATTLRSVAGQRATLNVGTLEIAGGTSGVTVSDLNIVGRADALTTRLNGDRFLFTRNDVTNNNGGRDQIGSCILVGQSSQASRGGVIRGNRIHNCGALGSNFGHGVYTQNVAPPAAGTPGITIEQNVMFGFGSYAVQLYPTATNAVVRQNVIDGGVGSIRGGIVIDGSSTGHRIEQNVIAWTETGGIVQRVGSGHVSSNNCFWQNPTDVSGSGITRSGDVNADPKFANRSAGDYRMTAGSTCLTKVGMDPAAAFASGGASTPAQEPSPAPTQPQPSPSTSPPAPAQPAPTVGAPTVRVVSPTADSRVRRDLRLVAEAAASTGRIIDRVEFRIDGRLVAVERGAPWDQWVGVSGLSTGYHQVVATAVDDAGRSTTSAPVRFRKR